MNAGLSQESLGHKLGVSGDKIGQIENEALPSLSILDACELSAVIGFDFSARAYPNGAKLRDAGQARRLAKLVENVSEPPSSWRAGFAIFRQRCDSTTRTGAMTRSITSCSSLLTPGTIVRSSESSPNS